MKIAWRIALVPAAALLGWRALTLGLGAHFAAQANAGDPAKLQAALAWDPSNLPARAQAAVAAQSSNTEAAVETWSDLLRTNPASAEALMGLARNVSDDARQDALVEAATTLAASSPATLKRAALHWVEREQPERALAAWSDALLADPGERDALYPILMKLIEDERTRVLLADYAKAPPAWWDEFFRHVARTASETDTVRGAYGLRRVPGAAPLTQIEREAYVERLRKDGLTTEAYLTWVNGLDEERRQFLGLLNNGSFEAEPTGIGWDWRVRSTKQLLAETAETYGTDGLRALHLVFRGFDDRLSHVSQELFLEPGRLQTLGQGTPQRAQDQRRSPVGDRLRHRRSDHALGGERAVSGVEPMGVVRARLRDPRGLRSPHPAPHVRRPGLDGPAHRRQHLVRRPAYPAPGGTGGGGRLRPGRPADAPASGPQRTPSSLPLGRRILSRDVFGVDKPAGRPKNPPKAPVNRPGREEFKSTHLDPSPLETRGNTMKPHRIVAAGILATGLTVAFGQAAASEPVATITQIDGIALVSQGSDYVTATSGMSLREGDRLMAMEGGNATITYANGCVHSLADNTITTIGSAESCANGSLASSQVGPYVAQAAGGNNAAIGAAIAGVVGVIVVAGAIGDDDNDTRIQLPPPPSP